MTGIGQASINSNLKILACVDIDDVTLNIVFHVLPDEYIQHDIVIGREILTNDVIVHMTSKTLTFKKILPDMIGVSTSNVESSVGSTVESNVELEAHTILCVESDPIKFNDINTDISSDLRQRLLSVLAIFSDKFIVGTPSSPANTDPMQIRLKDPNKTVCRRPYRLSPQERQVVRDKVKELLSSNVIRPSSSPFASPILLVKKKDGTDRMCVDYRELNDNTVPDRFPLPVISDQINRLHGALYFTTLDMASGFHQIPVHPDSIERTAFVTPDGQFEYLSMPFGLRNAPSVFQRAVTKVLGELANSFVVVYMDDILIIASTVDQALERLQVVLDVLTGAGFSFNLKKCSFLKKTVEYLGFEVSCGEIRPNPKKIEALVALSPPSTVTQLRQFIGLASYFRQFIPKFSQIMAPLFALTSTSKGNIKWEPSHETIRQTIISALTSDPVLTIFDPNCPIEVHTDASSVGYGAILIQKKDHGKRCVVAYYSKRTTAAEAKYHSYELETLAVVNAIKHFRHYLYGQKFTVLTDCHALESTRKKLDLTPRVHRWWAFLQSFDFNITHVEGKRMQHADFFSRNPIPEKVSFTKVEQKHVNIANLSANWLLAEQQRDEEILGLITKLKDLDNDIAQTYEIRSGILHRKIQRRNRSRCLPIVPRALRWSIVNATHESLMHLGWEKTLEKMYDVYWFDHMSKFVRKFVENCATCKMSKAHSGKVPAELHPIPKIAIPWHTLHIDATGKLSGKNDRKEYVFVLIDAFTKYVLLHHTLNIDTASSIRALKSCITLFGAPSRVIADQGRCFASTDFREFCTSHNISLHLIATGSSRANGQVERVMSTLKNMLTCVETSRDRSWQDSLPDVQLALNCTMNRVTKHSPLELLIGRVARPLDLMFSDEPEINIEDARSEAVINVDKSAQYEKARFDSNKSKFDRFLVGDFVLLKNEERNQTKLDPKYKGPFKVIEVLDGDRYTLKSLNGNRQYKYAHDRLRKMPATNSPTEFDSDVESVNETD